jgi:hypothetical protein
MAPFVKEFLVVTSWMWGSKVINTDIQTGEQKKSTFLLKLETALLCKTQFFK